MLCLFKQDKLPKHEGKSTKTITIIQIYDSLFRHLVFYLFGPLVLNIWSFGFISSVVQFRSNVPVSFKPIELYFILFNFKHNFEYF